MPSPQRNELDDLVHLIDYDSSPIIYYGYASPGTDTDEAKWMIVEETRDQSDRTVSLKYASGQAERKFVWDDRATLSYS